jgi:DNA-binding protein HU-beta
MMAAQTTKSMDAAMKAAEPTVKSRKSPVKRAHATKAAAVKRAHATKAAAVKRAQATKAAAVKRAQAAKAAAVEATKATTVEASTSKASRFECCWRDRYKDC